jgi:cell division septation protein DedD
MPYDFSLDRKATITLSAGSILLLVLVFVAGVLTGLTWRPPDQEIIAAQKAAMPVKPVLSTASAPPPPASAKAPATQATQTAPPSTGASQATPSPAAAASAAQTAAEATTTADIPGVQLAIQVGAFLDKANADKLVERLKEAGYAPQIVLGGHPPRQWNFVRVGPYHDWGEASQIAAVISRNEDTEAVVRPMR